MQSSPQNYSARQREIIGLAATTELDLSLFSMNTYVMRCNPISGLISGCGVFWMLVLLPATVPAGEAASPPPELLTNLFQLREEAEHGDVAVHPFRIVADVIDADGQTGALLLRDVSGAEFIRENLARGTWNRERRCVWRGLAIP